MAKGLSPTSSTPNFEWPQLQLLLYGYLDTLYGFHLRRRCSLSCPSWSSAFSSSSLGFLLYPPFVGLLFTFSRHWDPDTFLLFTDAFLVTVVNKDDSPLVCSAVSFLLRLHVPLPR
jgi:hypothetical protein